MSPTLLILKINIFNKFFFDISTSFRFSDFQKISVSVQSIPEARREPRFFTLTKVAMAKFCQFCHRHMGEISVMDQNNSVLLYERGFFQSEMVILWQCIEKIWYLKILYWNNVSRSMAKTSLGKRLYSQRNEVFRPCNFITYLKNRILMWE